jgi:predicted nucleic acid-binding protein
MSRFLLDTNTVNYLLKGREPAVSRFAAAVEADDVFLLGPITDYELTRYLRLKGSSRILRLYEELASSWTLCDLTFEDWRTASLVWAERHEVGRPITDLDLLMAVLARKEKAVLVTSNGRHFEGLGVPLEDWLTPS